MCVAVPPFTHEPSIARLENDICEKENSIPLKHYFSTIYASSMTLHVRVNIVVIITEVLHEV